MESECSFWNRREFLEGGRHVRGGAGHGGNRGCPAQALQAQPGLATDTPYPKLSIITPYSPEKLPLPHRPVTKASW